MGSKTNNKDSIPIRSLGYYKSTIDLLSVEARYVKYVNYSFNKKSIKTDR